MLNQLSRAAVELHQSINDRLPGSIVGVYEDGLRVYINRSDYSADLIPKTFNGFEVSIEFIGKIIPATT